MATTTGESAMVRSFGSSTTRSSASSPRSNGQSELDEAARMAEQVVDECCASGVHYLVGQALGFLPSWPPIIAASVATGASLGGRPFPAAESNRSGSQQGRPPWARFLKRMDRAWVWPTPARCVASIPRCVTGPVQVRRCSVGSRSVRSWCDRPAKRRSASSTSPSVSSSSSSTTSSSRATCWPSQSSTVLFSGSRTSPSLSRGRSCRRDVACLSRVMRVTSLSAVCHTIELRPRRRRGRRRPVRRCHRGAMETDSGYGNWDSSCESIRCAHRRSRSGG